MAQATGVRLVNMLNSVGWRPRRALRNDEIVQIAAVLICLDVLSQDIAKTTFRMYERLTTGGKREVTAAEHPIAALLHADPNRFHSWYEFFEMVMLHLGLAQNAFIAKEIREDGTTEGLIPCMPARVTILAVEPEVDPQKLGFYAYDTRLRSNAHEKIQMARIPQIVLQDRMVHLRGRMFDGLVGYSNLEAGAKTFGLANELVDYQTRLFTNDGQMKGVFTHPGEIGDGAGDAAFRRLREQLAEEMSDFVRQNKPIVLEEGMTFAHIAMNAEQSEVSKARDRAVVDVAQIFRIPPHKVMQLVNVKYENMETLEKSYVQDTLIPYCRRIEQKLERGLLTTKERGTFFFEFDRQEMLLGDLEKQGEAIERQAKYGAIEVDEIRQVFGRNPLPGGAGQVRSYPSTYNIVGRKNEIVIAAGGAKPGSEGDPATPAKPKKPAKDGVDDDSPSLHNVIPLRAGE